MSLSAITTCCSPAAAIDAMLSKARTAYFTTCNPSAVAAQRVRRVDKQRTTAPPRRFSAKLGGERIICTTAADAGAVDFVDRLLEGSATAATAPPAASPTSATLPHHMLRSPSP